MFSEFFLLKLLFHTNATKIRVIIKQVIEMHIKIQFIMALRQIGLMSPNIEIKQP